MKLRVILIICAVFITVYLTPPLAAADEITVYNASGEIISAKGGIAAAVIAIEIPDGSYIYANPKGKGIGKATELSVEQSRIVKSWEVRYPQGENYQAKGDTESVNIYRNIVRIPVLLVLRNDLPAGNLPVKINLSLLMCSSEACIPLERSLYIDVNIRKSVFYTNPVMMANISEFMFLPSNKSDVSEKQKLQQKPETTADGEDFPGGIIFTPRYPESEITGLLTAIVFGLIAGFILNFMPCVLPVVSLKIMSFVINAGERKNVIVKQGFLFSAGIVVSFIILAALAAFSGHKWGSLFQNRVFIIVMASFVFAMALSLFEIFTLNAPSSAGKILSVTRGIYADAFIKGIVATLLATPCSGPFLGGTLAWALTRPPEIIFVIFISIGTGMALPYMLLAINPSILKFLPKPGEWMNHFRAAMGFLLLFTVVYLLTILDPAARMSLVLSLLILSIGLWQFGIYGSVEKERWKRIVSFIILIIIAAAGYSLSFKYFFHEKTYSHEKIIFSAERILTNRDKGIISIVEFTADWCPNCSLVEKLALENDEVQKVFSGNGIEFMVADITHKNPAAESLMNSLGGKSIPLLAVFPPGKKFNSPLCLRDIYSADDVLLNIYEAEKSIIKK